MVPEIYANQMGFERGGVKGGELCQPSALRPHARSVNKRHMQAAGRSVGGGAGAQQRSSAPLEERPAERLPLSARRALLDRGSLLECFSNACVCR